jgi:hypothetical protein
MWGGSWQSDPNAREDCYINFLSGCVNLNTLALYFQFSHSQSRWTKLRDTVLTLMTNGKLTSLVFYSYDLWHDSLFKTFYYNVHIVLQAVADSEIARNRLKSLHLALACISPETERLVLSSFPKLGSLIIKRTLRERPGFDEVNGWKRLDSLTRLQINQCSGINAVDIPRLVELFPTLRELLVSNLSPWIPEGFDSRYPAGWHLLPNALCNRHRPLEWIHIEIPEHSNIIRCIGEIPTRVLIVTDRNLQRLSAALKHDVYLFPGMQILRYRRNQFRSNWDWGLKFEDDDDPIDVQVALNEWCTTRNVEMVKLEPK